MLADDARSIDRSIEEIKLNPPIDVACRKNVDLVVVVLDQQTGLLLALATLLDTSENGLSGMDGDNPTTTATLPLSTTNRSMISMQMGLINY